MAEQVVRVKYEALGSEGGAIYYDLSNVPVRKDREEFHRRHAPIAQITNNFENWNEWGKRIATAVNAHDQLVAALKAAHKAMTFTFWPDRGDDPAGGEKPVSDYDDYQTCGNCHWHVIGLDPMKIPHSHKCWVGQLAEALAAAEGE